MALKKFKVTVTQEVEVELDESHFTDEFNEVFSEVIFDVDCLEDHAEHLAKMEARGLIGFDGFVEGYGDIRKMGANLKIIQQDAEVEEYMVFEEPDF